jgi:hypothetical protein
MGEAPDLRSSRSGPTRTDDEWCENGAAGQPRCGICSGCKRKIRRMASELKALWEAGQADRSEPASHPKGDQT